MSAVGYIYRKEHSSQCVCAEEGRDDSDGHAGKNRSHAAIKNVAEDRFACRSKCDAYIDFFCSTRDEECERTAHTDYGKDCF